MRRSFALIYWYSTYYKACWSASLYNLWDVSQVKLGWPCSVRLQKEGANTDRHAGPMHRPVYASTLWYIFSGAGAQCRAWTFLHDPILTCFLACHSKHGLGKCMLMKLMKWYRINKRSCHHCLDHRGVQSTFTLRTIMILSGVCSYSYDGWMPTLSCHLPLVLKSRQHVYMPCLPLSFSSSFIFLQIFKQLFSLI